MSPLPRKRKISSASKDCFSSPLELKCLSDIAKLNEVLRNVNLNIGQHEALKAVINGYKQNTQELVKFKPNTDENTQPKPKKRKTNSGVRLNQEVLGAFQIYTLKVETAQNLFFRSVVSYT